VTRTAPEPYGVVGATSDGRTVAPIHSDDALYGRNA
jgi:hypothetical protein